MGRAHLFVSAGVLGLAVALVLAAAGCGSSGSSGAGSSDTTNTSPESGKAPAGATTYGCAASVRGVGELRATGAVCSVAAEVAAAWAAEGGCRLTASASRGACTVGRYRCLTTTSERDLAVSCARPGRSISFVFRG